MRKLLLITVLSLLPYEALSFQSYADLVENLMPSVVNISSQKEMIENEDIENVMLNPELRGRDTLGSGFFVRNDGHILTNAHVIKGAKKISIITNDNKSFDAKIVGIDNASDLAVLKIEDENPSNKFKAIVFGNANESRIGDIVLTFGNPYGLGVSVSQGIISAKSRNIGLNEQQYLQTDAAINQGNSGGPMFNTEGEVIGVNSAIFTMEGASGVGFSLPSNIANWVADQLIKHGKVKRGWIGIKVANGIDRFTEKPGFVITEINESSNAYKEGLRVGDVIISYNDTPAEDLADFNHLTETMDANQELKIKFLSYGEEASSIIKIQEMPEKELKNITNKALAENALRNIKNTLGEAYYISEFGITVKEAETRGLAIVKIDRRSILKNTGISEGDIILEADRSDIYSVDNLLENIRNAIVDDYRPISLLIQGVDNTFFATVEMVAQND